MKDGPQCQNDIRRPKLLLYSQHHHLWHFLFLQDSYLPGSLEFFLFPTITHFIGKVIFLFTKNKMWREVGQIIVNKTIPLYYYVVMNHMIITEHIDKGNLYQVVTTCSLFLFHLVHIRKVKSKNVIKVSYASPNADSEFERFK